MARFDPHAYRCKVGSIKYTLPHSNCFKTTQQPSPKLLKMNHNGFMTNREANPQIEDCARRNVPPTSADIIRLPARDVPLGGIRDMMVSRTLPQRNLPMVGAWCFLDEAGPEPHLARILPHPHTALQTVTWPLVGTIRHRDSTGAEVVIKPGQLNLMTAGYGISHSEFSPGDMADELHLLQFWVTLPAAQSGPDTPGRFEQHLELPLVVHPEAEVTVFMGQLGEVVSPATVYTPLVGAQVSLAGSGRLSLPTEPGWEYAVLVIHGAAAVNGHEAVPKELLYLGVDLPTLDFFAHDDDTLLILLGGEPFGEDVIMWWNFIGRSHEEIVTAREQWEAGSARFGTVAGHGGQRIPAPPLPNLRLTPRRRKVRH